MKKLKICLISLTVSPDSVDGEAKVNKKGSHLALDDIKDSIMELKVYRENFFNL